VVRDRPIIMYDTGWHLLPPPPKEVDEYTKQLIKQFRQTHKSTEHGPLYKITPEEWKSFWKGATERTSYGCGILHFGTWKAGSFSETITEVDALTDIPLQSGFSPLRWRVAIDALLLKKSWSNTDRETAHNFFSKVISTT
jgi:hypothetical protein